MITAPEQLTPELLTNILNDRGFLDSSVTSVANLLTKELPISVVSRVEISYSEDATVDAPTDLFLKMSAKGLAEQHCDKEVEFYTHLASEMPDGALISCYAAECSPETPQYYRCSKICKNPTLRAGRPFLRQRSDIPR